MVAPQSLERLEKNPKITIKLLIPPNVAGSIIGKNGDQIRDLKSKTKAHIKVSNRHEVFPYTNERIILLIAPIESTMEAISFIHSKIRSKSSQNVNGKGYRYRESERRQNEMKIIIADTTAGKVIGRKGETVKKIQEEHKVKIMLTSKDDWGVVPGERVATIIGEESDVNSAIEQIISKIQEDPYARLNRSLAYPPYPMFDYHGYMGPPETFRRDYGGKPKPPRKDRSYNDFPPRYNGYQQDRFRRSRAPSFMPRRSY